MRTFSKTLFPPILVGECVTLSVTTLHRDPLDSNNIFAVITDVKNDVYQVGTKHGLIKRWFSRTEHKKWGT